MKHYSLSRQEYVDGLNNEHLRTYLCDEYASMMRRITDFRKLISEFLVNFVVSVPQLLGYALTAATINWLIGGFMGLNGAMVLAEICSAMPTAGGIYYWSAKLGGEKYGPFLAWMTAWWNWFGWLVSVPAVAQAGTLVLISGIMVAYPDYSPQPWHQFLITLGGILYATLLNATNERVIKYFYGAATYAIFALYGVYFVWLPVKAPSFQPGSFIGTFVNATGFSDSYCWMIGLLYPAWTFFGYDASAHVSEETAGASRTAARGSDSPAQISGRFNERFTITTDIQNIGERGAVTMMSILYVIILQGLAAITMSTSRITYAISRDNILPGSRFISVMGSNQLPNRAIWLVAALSTLISCLILGNSVAFNALASASTVTINASYGIPIFARIFIVGNNFRAGEWSLGALSKPMGVVMLCWVTTLFVVLCLPEYYPITANSFNYGSVMVASVTLVGLISWVVSANKWFTGPRRHISEEEAMSLEEKLSPKESGGGFSSSELQSQACLA
ncbi:hypothetical protein HDU93_008783 [Gonapodya sp. JEL0774]|nr:hypothetical protein HDU93_008783 [Gonapodya sp. JEL0774]